MARRVFITGDTHQSHDIHKLNSHCFLEGNELTKDDILIICGDGGFVWDGSEEDRFWQGWLDRRPWTTVYVDGNHENFNLLKTYPEVTFMGAKAHKINNSLYHIERGEVMTINGYTFFCFGGAFSHDVAWRTENISWWQDELPNQEEVDHGLDMLDQYNNKVDFIITHDLPDDMSKIIRYDDKDMSVYDHTHIHLGRYLNQIYYNTDFKKWFAGHYHINRDVLKITILYNDILEIIDPDTFVRCEDRILNRTYTKEDIKTILQEEDLYISYEKIGRKDDFRRGEFISSAEEFFLPGVEEEELAWLIRMYNTYCAKRYTMED